MIYTIILTDTFVSDAAGTSPPTTAIAFTEVGVIGPGPEVGKLCHQFN